MTPPTAASDQPPRKRGLFVSLLCAGAALIACSPQGPPAPPVDPVPAAETTVIGVVDDPQALDAFLRIHAAGTRTSPPKAVVARTVDGGPAHPRITLVYMADPRWCGTGGCGLSILVPNTAGMAVLARATLVHPPVLILDMRTNGMPDIAVRVRSDYYPGDGAKLAVLPFDGQTYASNPTMPPAYLLRVPADGEIAISEDDVAIAFGR